METLSLYTVIGLLGVLGVLAAYGMMTAGKWPALGARYQWVNVIGTTGILISLIGQWNLPAFIANTAWISIGVFSLIRIYKKRSAA